jgi:hypothetical protein
LHDSLLPLNVSQTEQQGDGETGKLRGEATTPLGKTGKTSRMMKNMTKGSQMSRQMIGGSGGRLGIVAGDENEITFTQNKKPIEFVRVNLLTSKTNNEKGGV